MIELNHELKVWVGGEMFLLGFRTKNTRSDFMIAVDRGSSEMYRVTAVPGVQMRMRASSVDAYQVLV